MVMRITRIIVNILKLKHDRIQLEIEDIGFIKCNICLFSNKLEDFRRNKNGRYGKVCRLCRNKKFLEYHNRIVKEDPESEKLKDRIRYRKSIHVNMWRSLLRCQLNRQGVSKNNSTKTLLKYSHIELKYHIESLFCHDMCWENYGQKWQIDHIIPVSFFKNDATPDIVNALWNLRPGSI